MTWQRLFHRGGRVLAIGAILEIIGIGPYFLTLMVPQIPGLVFTSLLIGADVATVFGILAWYGSQMVETGTLGFNGFVVAISGLLLGSPSFSHLISGFFTLSVWRC